MFSAAGVVAHYLYEAIRKYGGCPDVIRTDRGTENVQLAAIQAFCGLVNYLQQNSVCNTSPLTLLFNFDGLPLFKSSSTELWPITRLVQHVSHTPFVVALYWGANKPASLCEYLHDFVNELCTVLANGITRDNKHYAVEVSCSVCDAPARSFMKHVKSHTGYNGCDKCKPEGVYISTDANFTSKEHTLQQNELNFPVHLPERPQ